MPHTAEVKCPGLDPTHPIEGRPSQYIECFAFRFPPSESNCKRRTERQMTQKENEMISNGKQDSGISRRDLIQGATLLAGLQPWVPTRSHIPRKERIK